MIIVTGLRSGTSLMMQTLNLLDFPVVGFLFHDDFCHKELNSKGYYDLPIMETINGLNSEKYKGKAVKLGGSQLYKTDSKYISKIINCKRKPIDTIKSIKRLMEYNKDYLDLEPTFDNAEIIYYSNLLLVAKYFEENSIPHITIYYEEMLLNIENTINRIKGFLNIDSDIDKAVLNVDKRSLLWQLE